MNQFMPLFIVIIVFFNEVTSITLGRCDWNIDKAAAAGGWSTAGRAFCFINSYPRYQSVLIDLGGTVPVNETWTISVFALKELERNMLSGSRAGQPRRLRYRAAFTLRSYCPIWEGGSFSGNPDWGIYQSWSENRYIAESFGEIRASNEDERFRKYICVVVECEAAGGTCVDGIADGQNNCEMCGNFLVHVTAYKRRRASDVCPERVPIELVPGPAIPGPVIPRSIVVNNDDVDEGIDRRRGSRLGVPSKFARRGTIVGDTHHGHEYWRDSSVTSDQFRVSSVDPLVRSQYYDLLWVVFYQEPLGGDDYSMVSVAQAQLFPGQCDSTGVGNPVRVEANYAQDLVVRDIFIPDWGNVEMCTRIKCSNCSLNSFVVWHAWRMHEECDRDPVPQPTPLPTNRPTPYSTPSENLPTKAPTSAPTSPTASPTMRPTKAPSTPSPTTEPTQPLPRVPTPSPAQQKSDDDGVNPVIPVMIVLIVLILLAMLLFVIYMRRRQAAAERHSSGRRSVGSSRRVNQYAQVERRSSRYAPAERLSGRVTRRSRQNTNTAVQYQMANPLQNYEYSALQLSAQQQQQQAAATTGYSSSYDYNYAPANIQSTYDAYGTAHPTMYAARPVQSYAGVNGQYDVPPPGVYY